jgi:Tfp pilus assembly protein PilZ
MSDPVSAAKSAREALARALGAIQSDPSVPQQLMAIAEPISNAMGALFQVERSGGAAASTSGPVAVDAVRRALSMLQQQPSTLPAVQIALEAVAGSLGLVHGLIAPAQAPAQQPYAQPAQYAQPAAQPYAQPVQTAQAYAATYVAPAPQAAPAQAAYQPTVQAYQQPAPQAAPAAAPGPGARIDAELGAHSQSNFYKGLSGNDVVEHGGLFVATYNIPRIGQPITLHVSMPGGYEFDAAAIVRWTRETVDSSSSTQPAQPGFGAQFTQITPEARQLVYRYVRNREPLFHDDL